MMWHGAKPLSEPLAHKQMSRPNASKLKLTKPDALTAPLSVGFYAEERAAVREAAFLSDQSVSAFIRAAAVKSAQRVLRKAPVDLGRAA